MAKTETLFSERVAEFSEGWLDTELTDRLADLIKAVKVTGKKGKLTLTLDIVPRNAKDGDIVIVVPKVTDTVPKLSVDPEVFRAYEDGDLEALPRDGSGLDDDAPRKKPKSKVTPLRGTA